MIENNSYLFMPREVFVEYSNANHDLELFDVILMQTPFEDSDYDVSSFSESIPETNK